MNSSEGQEAEMGQSEWMPYKADPQAPCVPNCRTGKVTPRAWPKKTNPQQGLQISALACWEQGWGMKLDLKSWPSVSSC